MNSSTRCCPLCDASVRFLFSKEAIGILECRKCKHRFADLSVDGDHVRRVYSDEYFNGGGDGYADYLSDRALRESQASRYAKILRNFTVPGYMLDIGAAAGFLLSGFAAEGWQGEGVEPNQRMAEHARDKLGLEVHAVSLEDYVASREFDLVTLIQVLPHFVDVRSCVERVRRMLRPGGYCLVESWDRSSISATIFGQSWHEYSPPSVLHYFSKQGINELMGGIGLSLVSSGLSRKWISARHGKSLLREKLPDGALGRIASSAAAVIPDRLSIPYVADDLIWMLFEKR